MKRQPLTFDELEIGMQGLSGGRTLNETDLSFSCMLSGGWHPIHADAEFAARSPMGQRILHGSYGLLIATGLAADLPDLGGAVLADLGLREWRYVAPLFVGDTIRADVRISGLRVSRDPGRGVLEREIRLIRNHDEVVQQGVSSLLVRRQGVSP